ncbi:VanZ family protein [Thiohalorhabdus denitrificans]|uniref:VanZ like family protein n=1 Tax=Thiohalorhabdus denitrificans TaxID=381306 RepID=A0A1G5ATB3_9GAMM|nr:VanZ family protein [Thiohalorhabdus denitrificans]SCX81135.1 VanZ like family protein [Thiohalorhabdus denitrificans]
MNEETPPAAGAARWVSAWLVWAVVIGLSSHLPGETLPAQPFEGADKVLHIGAYLVLGVLGVGAVARLRPHWPRPVVGSVALVVGALFGALDEYHQSFVAGRDRSMEDWVADLLGLAVAVIVARAARGGLARAWFGLSSPPRAD